MRVALYWHNGRSLGHTSESAKIAAALALREPAWPLVAVTGAHYGLEMLPDTMDVIRLPGFTNYDQASGWGNENRLGVTHEELFRIREHVITAFLESYRPECLVVNHLPLGAEGELRGGLIARRWLCNNILSLRGFLFDREKTNNLYFSGEALRQIEANYRVVTVHMPETLFRLEEYYDVPRSLSTRIRYTGYLTSPDTRDRQDVRSACGFREGERILVASMGGGQGTELIWRCLLAAVSSVRTVFDRLIFVTGPYLEKGNAEMLRQAAAQLNLGNLQVVAYRADLRDLIRSSDVFVGAAGSNMVAEVVAAEANAILIPRQVRECEQAMHARLLEARGWIRAISLPDVSSESLEEGLRMAVEDPKRPVASIATGGAEQYACLLQSLLEGGSI